MMVHMSCCNTSYATVVDTLNHRCGEQAAKFEAILDLEHEVQGDRASVAFAPINLPGYLADRRIAAYRRSKERLAAAIDALTMMELAAFGDYRKAALAAR